MEISDARVQLEAVSDADNKTTYTLSITSVAQLVSGDDTGVQGDVKIDYDIT